MAKTSTARDNSSTRRRKMSCLAAAAAAPLLTLTGTAQATHVFFDLNGATTGSGVTSTGGTWEGTHWNTNSAGVTTTPAIWSDAGDFAIFAAGTDATATNYTVNVASNHTVAGMDLQTNGGGTVTIASTGGTLALFSDPGGQGFFVGGVASQNLKITAPISGDATTPLAWSGALSGTTGQLSLFGNNTFQGGVMVNSGGLLNFNNNNSFGTGTITINIGTSGSFAALLGQANAPMTLANNFALGASFVSGAGVNFAANGNTPVNVTGTWTLGAKTPNIRNNGDSTSPLTLSGVISGTAGLTLSANNNGTILFKATNNYSGTTAISQGTSQVTLQAKDGVGLPTASFLSLDGGVLQGDGVSSFTRSLGTTGSKVQWTANGGGFSAEGGQMTVNIGNASAELVWGSTVGSQIVGTLRFGSASSDDKTLFVNGIDLNSTATTGIVRTVNVTGGAGGDSAEISGVIRNSGAAAALTETGTGTLILTGANTYSGGTNVIAGTLGIGNNSALGSSSSTLTLGGTSANSPTILASGAARTIANPVTLTTVGTGNAVIGGSNDLTINGAMTVSTANRILTVSNSGATTFGVVNLSDSAASGHTFTIGGTGNITFGGVIQNASSAGAGTGNITFSGYMGTATLNGANTYSGGTTLTSGTYTLVLGNKAAFGTGSIAANGVTISANTGLTGANAIANAAISLGGGNTFAGSNSIEFSGTVTATASRNINNTMSGASLTLSGPINISSNATNNTLTITGTGNTKISGAIANGGTATASKLAKNGTGTLTLSNINTYDGATTINIGTLIAASNTALGSTVGSTTVSGGAALGFQGGINYTSAEPVTIAGTGISSAGAINNISDANSFAGPVTMTADSSIGAASGSLALSGGIGGSFTVTKVGAGTVTLSGTNTYSATTVTAGTLAAGAANTLPSGGAVSVSGGTLDIAANDQSVGTVQLAGGSITGTTGVLTSNADYDMQSGTASAILAGSVGLTKTTSGTVALSGTNTFTGATSINVGTLIAASDAALGTTDGSTTVISGAALGFQDGINYTTAEPVSIAGTGISGAGAINNISDANSFAGPITMTADSSIGAASGSLALSGGIGGPFALTKVGAGTVALSGINTYTATSVSAGTLAASTANALPSGGAVLVSGGTLDIAANDQSVGTVQLTGGSITGSTGVLTSSADYDMQSGSASAILAGSVGLAKTTSGTVALSGVNTFAGDTTINAGTLQVSSIAPSGSAQPLGVATTAIQLGSASPATLEYTGSSGADLQRDVTVNGSGGGTINNSGGATLTLSGTLTKDGTTLTLAGGAINVTGTIQGASPGSDLDVDGATVTLSNANTYNGPTNIYNGGTLIAAVNGGQALPPSPFTTVTLGQGTSSGTLALGNSASGPVTETVAGLATSGTGTTNAVVGGNGSVSTLIANINSPQNFGGSIGSAAANGNNIAVVKTGTDTLVLSNFANSYSGNTTISTGTLALNTTGINNIAASPTIAVGSAGTLDVNNVTGSGGFTVAPGQTLTGTGTVTGSVTVDTGSTIAAGTSAATGVLTTGSQNWKGGGTYAVKLNTAATDADAGTGFDQLSMSGLTISASSGSKFIVAIASIVSGSGAAFDDTSNYSWIIAKTTLSHISSFNPSVFSLVTSGFSGANYTPSSDNTSPAGTFALSDAMDGAGDDIVLSYTAAPEPTSLFLFGAVAMPIILPRRRRILGQAKSADVG